MRRAAASFLCAASAAAFISVDPASHHFVGDDGRVRVFHGVNAVYKLPPYMPVTSGPPDSHSTLTAADFAQLAAW